MRLVSHMAASSASRIPLQELKVKTKTKQIRKVSISEQGMRGNYKKAFWPGKRQELSKSVFSELPVSQGKEEKLSPIV